MFEDIFNLKDDFDKLIKSGEDLIFKLKQREDKEEDQNKEIKNV